jgi:hypothetical protein
MTVFLPQAFPESAIAFIHDTGSDQAKMNLFNAVNAGRVSILIGSTEKLGAGMNVQRRLRTCIIWTHAGARATSSSSRKEFCARAISTRKWRFTGGQIFFDQPLRHRMHRNKPDLSALAPDPKMHHALTALHVLDPQAAQLLAAHVRDRVSILTVPILMSFR